MIYLGQNAIGITDVIGVTPIDDTAGEGDTTKVWSADKTYHAISDVADMVADTESTTTAASAHAKNTVFILNGKLYMATAAIAVGDTIVTSETGQNVVEVTLAEAFPNDVQVAGTSVVSNGVANIPYAGVTDPGVIKVEGSGTGHSYGLGYYSDNTKLLVVKGATAAQIKAGTQASKPIVPATQDASAFYGFAKAAGDSTQSASSNAVGTYTETAKSAISTMLNAPVTVSGATPSITAMAGVRYICGEVSTLTIVVPSSGIIDVVFESGSTATVLTVTPPSGKTMKWIGEDPTALEANKTYEINIKDGCLGVVVSWT